MKRFVAVFLVITVIILSGCSGVSYGGETVIAASFYPVYIFTLNLLDGVEGVCVCCMAETNVGCLHDYRLLASDARLLADSTALVINGAGMESFIEDAYKNNKELTVIDSSSGIELIENEDSEHEEHIDTKHEDEAAEHEEHSHEGHSHAGHSHEVNSHIWMSVDNALIQVENISDALCELLPEHAEKITLNRDLYSARLKSLKAELLKESFSLRNEPVISFHEAYSYMARELSLNIVTTIESDEGGEPTASELARLSRLINQKGVKALFTEAYYKGSAADILSFETGVPVYALNPVTSGEKTLTAYEDIMRENLSIMKKAVES